LANPQITKAPSAALERSKGLDFLKEYVFFGGFGSDKQC